MSAQNFPWYRTSHRCWYVWHEGRQVRLDPDKDEALCLWHRLEAGVWTPDNVGASLGQVIDEYLNYYQARRSAAGLEIKRAVLLPLRDALRRTPAACFDGPMADAFLEKRGSWGPGTRRTFCSAVKTCLRWSLGAGTIGRFPLEGWTVPSVSSRRAAAVVSAETHEALLRGAPGWLKDVLLALHAAGCRPSEACGVTAHDFRGDCWVLVKHKTAGASGEQRVVHLTSSLASLCERLADRRPTGPLFRGGRGGPIGRGVLKDALRRLCLKLGLPHVFPYAYRHTYATDLLAAGVPDATVAELLGHRGTAMLHRHYSHLCARRRHLSESLAKARP